MAVDRYRWPPVGLPPLQLYSVTFENVPAGGEKVIAYITCGAGAWGTEFQLGRQSSGEQTVDLDRCKLDSNVPERVSCR